MILLTKSQGSQKSFQESPGSCKKFQGRNPEIILLVFWMKLLLHKDILKLTEIYILPFYTNWTSYEIVKFLRRIVLTRLTRSLWIRKIEKNNVHKVKCAVHNYLANCCEFNSYAVLTLLFTKLLSNIKVMTPFL